MTAAAHPQPRTTTSIVPAEVAVTVGADSDFGRALSGLITRKQIRRVIETGTYYGTGTTRAIARALKAAGGGVCYTIEVNPQHYAIALQNLRRDDLLDVVRPLLGLTVPRSALPDAAAVRRATIDDIRGTDVIVDHDEGDRVERYLAETHNPGVPDDLIGLAMQAVDYAPDLVLLDSGGHMGFVEFSYLISRLQSPTYIALDDIRHIKHQKSWATISSDPRFQILIESNEKFGFGIARFTPAPLAPRRLLWIRTDALGDGVWASGMLPAVRRRWPDASLTVLCNTHTHPLLETNPHIDRCVVLDKGRLQEPGYFDGFAKALHGQFDLVLVSHFSREVLIDLLAKAVGAPIIGYDGNENLYRPGEKALTDRFYTKLISPPATARHEVARHRHFLTSLGIEPGELEPQIYVTSDDTAAADALFTTHGLTPERTVVLVAGVGREHRVYERYGEAIGAICRAHGLRIAAVGTPGDRALIARNLRGLEDISVDLSGQTTVRALAAFIGRTRLVAGAETGTTNLASAMGVPTVTLMGGGDFARFLPASPTDVIACLPLACFGCGWKCHFSREHCVRDAMPDVLGAAVAAALADRGTKPRVFVPNPARQRATPGLPSLGDVRQWLSAEVADVYEVGQA
ncbi:MAG: glycosyltransferase family 9 protein [Gemmatimonadaceae bacterium]|nr:glycosyltransferase family 9 protein [Gemmatimonadaceae bacterium]